ncbi:putative HNH endonuclease [Escherichia phage JLBYU43]|uniref:HNH endonuclease n=1 Tax=Escherichia phage JLBYU43 TaxID=2894751 RepID=A0AAE9CFJ6_9CAUD|nr:putative HNH endonuclease [Escherichia phage JLBYU43]
MITQERLKELFDYSPETGEFTRKVSRGNQKAGSIVNRKDSNGYIIIGIDGKDYKAHRMAFLFMENTLPEKVDHVNRIPFDNRWCNLRDATAQENSRNKTACSKSGYLGVAWDKKNQKWEVRVRDYLGNKKYFGRFNYLDLQSAVEIANKARLQLHGERAVIEIFDIYNYPALEELNS